MKNILNIKTLFYVATFSLVFTSCTNDDYQKPINPVNVPALTAGTADFSNYVAVGNSLTAGFADGALFMKAQENSITNLLANKFAMAGGGAFTQPMMADNVGGLLLGGTMIQGPRLYFNGAGPAPVNAMPTTEIIGSTPGPYNNMGVPGAKVGHLLYNGYGNVANLLTNPPTANPYFVRMASSPTATVLGDAMAQAPTFFSLWIGANDVLGYALSGGDGTNPITPSAGPPGFGFDQSYGAIVTTLTSGGAKGVVLNIPYITSLPYFTTIPYDAVPLDAATATQLNTGFASYNTALDYLASISVIPQAEADMRKVVYAAGQNPVLIMDETLTDLTGINPALVSMRPATANDLIILSAKSFIGTLAVPGNPATVNGVAVPLADKWVLLPSEQQEIATAIDAYNVTIKNMADANGLAFVDANQLMQTVGSTGVSFDSFTMTDQYIFGGLFSLDGIHPTARGNAFISNEILKAIDATYGSNFEASQNLNKAADFVTQYPANL